MNQEPLAPITDAEAEAYARDGAVRLRGMIDTDWTELLLQGVAKSMKAPGPLHTVQTLEDEPGFFLADICMAQEIPEYRKFLLNAPVGAIAARLMGSARVNFFADLLWVKEAGTGKRTRWHQDQAFFWVAGKQMCVIWWPLDPVPKESSLELVRGSHQWGKWYAPELSKHGKDLYSSAADFDRMPDIDADRGAYDIMSWDVEPGDCVAFHGSTVHGAAGVSATAGRRAFSTCWMGDDARYAARPSAGRPHFEGHGLHPGDAMDCGHFPRVWPRPADGARLDARDFERFTDDKLVITN